MMKCWWMRERTQAIDRSGGGDGGGWEMAKMVGCGTMNERQWERERAKERDCGVFCVRRCLFLCECSLCSIVWQARRGVQKIGGVTTPLRCKKDYLKSTYSTLKKAQNKQHKSPLKESGTRHCTVASLVVAVCVWVNHRPQKTYVAISVKRLKRRVVHTLYISTWIELNS